MDINATARPPGRPREFEIEEALDKAIVVFSERGYHAASISELKDAMGLAAEIGRASCRERV